MESTVLKRYWLLALTVVLTLVPWAQPQSDKLQIHHIYVGQGGGAVLISPNGEVVLFEMGQRTWRRVIPRLATKAPRNVLRAPASKLRIAEVKKALCREEM